MYYSLVGQSTERAEVELFLLGGALTVPFPLHDFLVILITGNETGTEGVVKEADVLRMAL